MPTNAELTQRVEQLEAQLKRFNRERLLQVFEDTYAVHKKELWSPAEYAVQRQVWEQIVDKILAEE